VRQCRDGDEHTRDEVERQRKRRSSGQRGILVPDKRGQRVAKAAERGGADHHGDREGQGCAAGNVRTVGGPPDPEQHSGHDRRGADRREHAAGDDGSGRDGGCAPALEHSALALRGHRGHQVAEARRDHPEGDDAGHVVHRRADLTARDPGGVPAAAEHRGEDQQEQHWQDQGEELQLAVAGKGAQVIAGQVQGHLDHR
jgi:hypothetical protein